MPDSESICRVSDYYKLDYKQGELPFVDVDVFGDTCLFIDPRAIRFLHTEWGNECVTSLQSFFESVIEAIKLGQNDEALRLLSALGEPNETHLGLSRDKAQGRGLGTELAKEVWELLSTSRAVRSGLLVDLEDTALLIDKVGPDLISDIATNVIRGQLLSFTQDVCKEFGIPLEKAVDSGPLWDFSGEKWCSRLVDMPVTKNGRLLLVPKEIVRKHVTYDPREYLNHYVLTHMQSIELNANSELVQLLKNGGTRVTKKSVAHKYGTTKNDLVALTQKYPEILERYRSDKSRNVADPLSHEDFEAEEGIGIPRWNDLLGEVVVLPTGKENADNYHKAIERLLTPLFYPNLIYPVKEAPIHDGRKRLDILYSNMAVDGFMKWLSSNYPAAHVVIECKNYSGDPQNPELDQISSRFSPSRGKVGFLLCRNFEDKGLFFQRCIDTAKDDRGFVIPLDDDDIKELVKIRQSTDKNAMFKFWKDRFDRLVM